MKAKDETGNIYGYLTVIERVHNSPEGKAMWLCKCKCGNKVIVSGKNLRSGNTKSCGCYQKEMATTSNLIRGKDLTGRRFGKLTVIKEDGFIKKKDGRRARLWLCQCDCGNTCSIQHQYLTGGDTSSCGCLNSKGNMIISNILTLKRVNYSREYSFKDLLSDKDYPLRFDFAILNNDNTVKCLIEYQGDIHYKTRDDGWNTQESFELRKKYDNRKLDYCNNNNIKIYYISYFDNIEEKMEEILNELFSE